MEQLKNYTSPSLSLLSAAKIRSSNFESSSDSKLDFNGTDWRNGDGYDEYKILWILKMKNWRE